MLAQKPPTVPGIPWSERFTPEWHSHAKAYAWAHTKIGWAWNGRAQDIARNHRLAMEGKRV